MCVRPSLRIAGENVIFFFTFSRACRIAYETERLGGDSRVREWRRRALGCFAILRAVASEDHAPSPPPCPPPCPIMLLIEMPREAEPRPRRGFGGVIAGVGSRRERPFIFGAFASGEAVGAGCPMRSVELIVFFDYLYCNMCSGQGGGDYITVLHSVM